MIGLAGAKLAPRESDGRSFGPGLVDHERGRRLRRASEILYRHRLMLRGAAGMFHQGRTLGLLDVTPATVLQRLDVAPPCGRFLIQSSRAAAARSASRLADSGFEVDTALVTVAADSADVRGRIDALRTSPPPGMDAGVRILGRDSTPSLVHAVQALQVERGLTPMPDWFLRADGCDAIAAAWISPTGAVAAAATVQPLPAFGRWARPVLGSNICVRAVGSGWGSYVNAWLLGFAIDRLGATGLIEIVEAGNAASLAMNRKAGLNPKVDIAFLFAESADG